MLDADHLSAPSFAKVTAYTLSTRLSRRKNRTPLHMICAGCALSQELRKYMFNPHRLPGPRTPGYSSPIQPRSVVQGRAAVSAAAAVTRDCRMS
jgi:hypothetical protein